MLNSTFKMYLDLFEYKELTPVIGEPDIDSLIVVFQQLKRNAQRIPTTLGGGLLGYLALVLPPTVYLTVPNAQVFVCPVHPGPFLASGNRLTAADIAEEKAEHDEEIRLYNECITVEQLLRQQLVSAIPSTYLDSMRNDDTDMINDSIPDIISFLQQSYCRLSPQEMSTREEALKRMTYNPDLHVNVVFNTIKKFQTLCQLVKKPKTDDQWVDIAYIIFSKSEAFKDTLITWNAKTTNTTYADFKTHITERYHALGQVGGLKVKDSSLNLVQTLTEHQNKLTSQLKDELNETLQSNFMYAVRQLQQVEPSPTPTAFYDEPPPAPSVNSVSDNTAILQLLRAMETKIAKLETKSQRNQPSGDINPKTGKPFKRYCWTHGCCTHWGKNCPNKAPGHQDDATFKERKNGSNTNCLPIA